MSGTRMFLISFVTASCLAAAGTASAYHTRFIANNCNYAAPTPTPYITRDGSITVALNLSDRAIEVPLGPGERVLEGGLGPQEAAVIGTD